MTADNTSQKLTPEVLQEMEKDRPLENSRPFQKMLGRLSNKWNVLVIRRLASRPMRPSELRRNIGNISAKVLTHTLRELESFGLIERTVYPVIPPKVEYQLTELGHSLMEALDVLRDWAMENNSKVEAAIDAYDDRTDNQV